MLAELFYVKFSRCLNLLEAVLVIASFFIGTQINYFLRASSCAGLLLSSNNISSSSISFFLLLFLSLWITVDMWITLIDELTS